VDDNMVEIKGRKGVGS